MCPFCSMNVPLKHLWRRSFRSFSHGNLLEIRPADLLDALFYLWMPRVDCELTVWCCAVLLVKRLCECWQSAMETVTLRQQTLESMLIDSRRFEQLYIETDRWIVQTSQRCQQDAIGTDIATVKQQKDIVEVFNVFIHSCIIGVGF